MGKPGWMTPEMAAELGMVRAHNGIGWCWVEKGSDMERALAEETTRRFQAGEAPPDFPTATELADFEHDCKEQVLTGDHTTWPVSGEIGLYLLAEVRRLRALELG